MTLLLHCTKAHVSLTRYRVVESELTSQIWCKEFWEVFKSNVQWTVRILSVSETAVLHVLSDLLEAVDSGDVAALVLPDLSAAFDTVNHFVPSAGTVLWTSCTWASFSVVSVLPFCSFPVRSPWDTQIIFHSARLRCCSVMGPILFIMYTVDLIALIEGHRFFPHLYADDTQVYGSCRPSAIHDPQRRLSACIDDVHNWMHTNRLQLNTNKTELL